MSLLFLIFVFNGCVTTIGTADSITAFVTRRDVVIYELIFPVVLQHPVILNITYTSETGDSQFRLTGIRYNSSNIITYKETNENPPPYPVYYVSISLVAVKGKERIFGPATESPEKIGMYHKSDMST